MQKTLGVIIGVAFLAAAIGPIAGGVTSSSGVQTVTNETITASTTTYVDLDGYDLEAGSETVHWLNESSGEYEALAASAYDLRVEPGEISFNAPVSDGDAVKVSYEYAATDDRTATVLGFLPLVIASALVLVIGYTIQGAAG